MPRVFSVATISNAVMLASFQNKGFPRPSTNRVVLWADRLEGEPMPPYLAIEPSEGQISYSLGDRGTDSEAEIWTNEAAVGHAWNCISTLGVDSANFVRTNVARNGVWGVFFPRQVDGIQIYDQSEGFSFQQFGKEGKIRTFGATLPNLQRDKECPTATPQQIIACIRAFKTPSPPNGDEPDYFRRIKDLANARRLTIIRITPYYIEGMYGENATNDPPKSLNPIAQLEAVVNYGVSNSTVVLIAPILSADAEHLLRSGNSH